jgi:hypothetical protein
VGIRGIESSWDTEAEWDLGTKVDVDGVSPGDLVLTKQADFTERLLYGGEVWGSGTVAIAELGVPVGSGFNIPGLTKENALLKIDLKCTDWSKLNGDSQLELTSSGGPDNKEWHFTISGLSLNITSVYKTFYLDMSLMDTQGGELDVSDINFIRWYAVFSTSQTIYWKNAEIVQAYHDFGYRTGPDINLSPIAGNVAFSHISWASILNGGSINIMTRYSLDGGLNFTSWESCTSGSAIPGLFGKNVSNGVLQCAQELYTNTGNEKGRYTPQLRSLDLEVAGQKHSVNLAIYSGRSFNMQGTVASSKACRINMARSFNMQGAVASSKPGLVNVSREIRPVSFSRSAVATMTASAEKLQQVLRSKALDFGSETGIQGLLVMPQPARLILNSEHLRSVMETWRRIVREAESLERLAAPGGAWTMAQLPGGSFAKQDRPGNDWTRLSKPAGGWTGK